MRVAVNSHALPIYKKNRIASLLCIFETTIIALKASGRDCTNNNELLHKIGVSQRFAMQYSYLQDNDYKRFDGAVSITVVIKESDKRVEGSSPIKTFLYFIYFIFFFFAFAKMQIIFRDLHVCRKKHVLMYYAQTKSLHSVKWRSLYGDTGTMQELLLTTYTRLQEGKEYVLKKVIIWKQRMHRITETRVCKFPGPD